MGESESVRGWEDDARDREMGKIEILIYLLAQTNNKYQMEIINSHRELRVYKKSFEKAMDIFRETKKFPKEELYSLTDQIRRSSRSVSSNIAEAFRKRRYPKSFCSKLNESEAEAAETQNWLDFALECDYLTKETHKILDKAYEEIIGMLVNMQKSPEKWGIIKNL